MKLYAIHTIHRGTGNAAEVIAAKSIFDASKEEFDDLAKLGAVRKASSEEIALAEAAYKAKNGGSAEGFEKGDGEADTETETPAKTSGRGKKADAAPDKDADI